MSYITHISAGILALAALTAPSVSHAQALSEKAFLNRPSSPVVHSWTASSAAASTLSGEQALLAPTPAVSTVAPPVDDTAAPPTDGAYALLGESRPLAARRGSVPAASR
jgi:hypothetical protein